MEVIIKIPDWAKSRTMYVIFGRETYMIRNPDGTTYIKTVRCDHCGKCCQEPGDMFPMYIPEGEKVKYCAHCEYDPVDKIWVCRNQAVPFGCIRETGGTLPHKDCIMEYKVTK